MILYTNPWLNLFYTASIWAVTLHLLDNLCVTSQDIVFSCTYFMLCNGKKRYQYEHELHRIQHRNVYKRSSFCIFKTSFTLWHRRKNTMYTNIVGKHNIHLHSLQKRSENITQSSLFCLFIKLVQILIRFRFLVSNATFNNISIISWRSALLVENSGVPRENYRPA